MTKLQAVVIEIGNDLNQREVGRLFVGRDGRVESKDRHPEVAAVLRTSVYSRRAKRRVDRDDGEDFLRALPSEYGSGSRVRVGLIEDGRKEAMRVFLEEGKPFHAVMEVEENKET